MRKTSAVVIGGVVLALLIGAGVFWWLRPTPTPSASPPAAPTARRQLPPTPPPPPQGALQVQGRVVDLQGKPVAGIEVSASVPLPGETLTELACDTNQPDISLASEDCASPTANLWVQELVESHRGGAFVLSRTTSAQDGTFTLEGLPQGTVTLWALGSQGAGLLEDVASGTQDVTLELEASQPITGRVVDEDGAPLSNVQVTVLHTSTARYFDTRTGADGRFSLGPLPEDAYGLLAASPGRITAWMREVATGPLLEDVVLYAPRRIVGTVLDGEHPVAGATVTEVDSGRVATTDAQGRFALEGLSPDDYTLEAEQGGLLAREPVTLPEDQREVQVTLRLGTTFFVEATVRDTAGKPVAHAEVNADLPSEFSEHYGAPIFQPLGRTDEDGRIRLGPLRARDYTFLVVADRLMDLTAVRTAAASGPPLEFVLSPAVLVEGIVTDAAGQPVVDASLSLQPPARKRPADAPPPVYARSFILVHPPREVPVTFDATSDAEGHFAIKVDQALSGTLTVEADGYLPRKLQVRAPTSGLKLTLDSGATVRGTVTNSRGTPVNDVDISLAMQEPEPSPGSREAPEEEEDDDDKIDIIRMTFAGTSGEDGRFDIKGIPPGTYAVWMRTTTGGYERLMPDRVVLRGSETVELALRLDLDGRVGGIVVDSEGRPLADVTVDGTAKEDEASNGRGYSPLIAKTGPDGRFVLEPLARDWDYELTAVKPGYALPRPPKKESPDESPADETLEEMRARLDRWMEEREGPKIIARAGNMGVRITLAFQGRITGRLARKDGTPITRFTVNEETVRDPKGAFTVFVDEPGPQHLTFEVPGHAFTQRDVDVPEGRNVDLGTVHVEAGHTIKGRVVDDATGAPLAGVSISLALPAQDVANAEHASSFADVTTGPDGTFQLPAVESRPYMLTAQEAEHALLERIVGPTEDTLELRLTTSTRLEVTARDAQGRPPSSMLAVVPKANPEEEITAPANDGVALFRDLAPGDYVVKIAGGNTGRAMPRVVRVEPHRVNRVDLPLSTTGLKLRLRWSERGRQGTSYLLPGRVPEPSESASPAEVQWLREQALPPLFHNAGTWVLVPPGPYTLLVLQEREGRWLSFRQDVTVGAGTMQDVQDVEIPALPW
ncbi:carboxypeptidase regulatory-like domain-containing protein [Corallococcus exiguus]|uniref:carboxypeptidase-like regulatory domain-containing protein n=1 Tax=Corallococcus exiguus TaxID=83462 RepID=UPI001A8EF3E8|nr:carboxypeptidase-like regulatory domain-containing protein [Corallococcus exiguus]MBN8470941.1 carboxypeptidase regulatory-like domain-containing protein [Corallococcus exiguus]